MLEEMWEVQALLGKAGSVLVWLLEPGPHDVLTEVCACNCTPLLRRCTQVSLSAS